MASDELLAKIDRTLERNAAESHDHLERYAAESREFLDKHAAESRDYVERSVSEYRASLRELMVHHAQVVDSMLAGFHGWIDDLRAESRDQREQIQANTAAVLKALDRLGPGPA